MDFRRSDLAHGHELEGLVVVVDVLRAFSTSAYAFAAGARAVVVAHSLDEIEPLKRRHAPAITVGAQPGGFPVARPRLRQLSRQHRPARPRRRHPRRVQRRRRARADRLRSRVRSPRGQPRLRPRHGGLHPVEGSAGRHLRHHGPVDRPRRRRGSRVRGPDRGLPARPVAGAAGLRAARAPVGLRPPLRPPRPRPPSRRRPRPLRAGPTGSRSPCRCATTATGS